jgi:hypothetical protein
MFVCSMHLADRALETAPWKTQAASAHTSTHAAPVARQQKDSWPRALCTGERPPPVLGSWGWGVGHTPWLVERLVLDPTSNHGAGPYSGMSALLPVLLSTAVDPDQDVVMLSHGLLTRICQAGLLPRLLPGVYAADALADALGIAIRTAAPAAPGGSAGAGAGPEASPLEAGAPLQDTVRTSLRALDAIARALPDAVSASKRLQDLYILASKSMATKDMFAAIRAAPGAILSIL